MYPLTFICIISLLWNHSLSTELKDSVENSPQQRLLGALLKNYDGDARPLSAKSQAVTVSFGAKLVRIIELNERGNTIRSQWSIYQVC
ncbi:Neuronal acetylcholine receptor subunit alpha-7 [Porites harrisoni]